MDKKPNRNSSNSSRASSGTDLKKSLGKLCFALFPSRSKSDYCADAQFTHLVVVDEILGLDNISTLIFSDGSTCKLGARAAPRRREPPGGFSKSSEINRKPQPQRNGKAFDKRPKPRGYYYAGYYAKLFFFSKKTGIF